MPRNKYGQIPRSRLDIVLPTREDFTGCDDNHGKPDVQRIPFVGVLTIPIPVLKVAYRQPILVLDGKTIGTIFIRSDLQAFYSRLMLYLSVGGIVMLVSIFVAYLLSTGFQRSISMPILYLAQRMKLVTEEKNYTIRAEKTTRDEVGEPH